MLKNTKLLIALSLLPQYFLIKWLSSFPEFIEQFYSKGLYLCISKILRFTLGWLPFSFGDLVYTFAIVYGIRWFYKNRKRLYKDTKNWLIDIFCVVALFYGAFYLLWGLNYYRLPLHERLNLSDTYKTEQLVRVTKMLIETSNALQFEITKNDTVKVDVPFSKSEVFKMIPKGYYNLKKTYPVLEYQYQSLKKSIYSYPLTYMGFSGYINPFTNEAQVDGLIPVYKFPPTLAHEMAHQLGYAAENEANFIGFLATISHDNQCIKYTGYSFALRFCLNEIYRRDKALYKSMITKVNKGVLKNYKAVRDFWIAHKNPAEPVFKSFYDTFLKANKQSKGIQSYSYVVALIVSYFENEPL